MDMKTGLWCTSAALAISFLLAANAASAEGSFMMEKGRVVASGDIGDLSDALVHRHMAV
jgi:hypothetical protein